MAPLVFLSHGISQSPEICRRILRPASAADHIVISIIVLFTLVIGLNARCAFAADPELPQRVEFNRDIRPILSDNCFYCHGPDAKRRQADLRLDVRDAAIESHAIVPGALDKSALISRIDATDAEERMPPADSHKKLTDRQRALLKLWVEQGAEYQPHWSYEQIKRPEIPDGQHPIDYLIKRQLSQVGLVPSQPADRRTLIRRLYFDLLGLPPTPEAVRAFESDLQPDAYSRLVESLLSNPHYGERMALSWLDVVRFADTIGYHSDTPRNVWPYRDWVIDSFNQNKPFDRFTLEQIAGDLLPDADQQSLIGSAFNRLLLSTEEGGAQPKDYEARMLTDRVRAVGTVWLGQTTGCAQCHDHKFDPFTTRDFYALGAFFADIKEPIVGAREGGMLLVPADQQSRASGLRQAVQLARQEWTAIEPEVSKAQAAWEAAVRSQTAPFDELKEGSAATEDEKKEAKTIRSAVESPKRSAAQKQAIADYFIRRVEPRFAKPSENLRQAERQLAEFEAQLPRCLVSESNANPRIVRVLPRGNWMDETGEIVQPQLPGFLATSTQKTDRLTRLDLAKWLVSRDNPLTARTVMNRLWRQFFGSGLSRVLDDLGAQGEPPTNPDLLNFLASEFMESGWDFRHMVRLLVHSETYQQSSISTPELLTADPDNRWYARQTAFRLDAELIRDNVLAISGLLDQSLGGPSVKPYQPAGYWENLNFPTRNYVPDSGPAQHRRGLYVWWQRSFLHPSFMAFDAPSREECIAERNRSNIPQQALVLLNDPTFMEASSHLAEQAISKSMGTANERIEWIWQRALQRSPTEEELSIISELFQQQHQQYLSDPEAAEKLLSIGQTGRARISGRNPAQLAELAAWTHIARVAFNIHESITRN